MTEWRTTTLGAICAEGGGFIRTGPFGSQLHQSDYVDDPNGIPVVMPKDMAGGRIDLSTIARIDQDTATRLSHHLLAAGDIVLSRRGDVGRTAWIANEDLPVLCGTGSMRIHPGRTGSVHLEYLRYFMRSRLAIDYLEGQAVGATMPNLNAGIVSGLPVTLPPIEQQRLVADILASIEELIENIRRRIDLLEQMAQAIYEEWFVRFRYPGHEDVTLVDSPLGQIPAGWDVLSASTLLTINPRVALETTSKHPFVTMGDVSGRSMICFPSEMRSGSSGSKFQNGDTLFARITPCLENGKTAYVQSLAPGETGRGSTEFIVLRGRRVGPTFTYMLARVDAFRSNAIQSMTGASGRQRVRNECFDSYLVAAPSKGLADRFEEVAEPMVAMAYSLARRNQSLAKLRDLVLPRLVTGHIDVSRLDLDALVDSVA